MAGETMYHVFLKGKGKRWSSPRWGELPIYGYLKSVSGLVATGPADGLVEVRGEGKIVYHFDWAAYAWMSPHAQVATRQEAYEKLWPFVEVPTLLSGLLPHWFKPRSVFADSITTSEEIKAVFPLTDLDIVWL